MKPSGAENEESASRSESAQDTHHQTEAIANLFRLLQTSVQTMQLKIGGQIVVPAQDVVGVVVSAKAEFEHGKFAVALQQLTQAGDSFRHKIVRWEAAARAAQAGQGRITLAQKRQLPAEISAVRTGARKAQLFFDRLLAAVTDFVPQDALPAQEADASDASKASASSLYKPVKYVATAEVRRRVGSADGLTKMMVDHQFEELQKLLRSGPFRRMDLPIQPAWDAFKDSHYATAKTKLNETYQTFLQLISTRKPAGAEIVDEDFRTLSQGISKIEQALQDPNEKPGAQRTATTEIEAEADPVEGLNRLYEIMESSFDKIFPPGSPREHVNSAREHWDLVAFGPTSELIEHLQALRHATTCGADDNAPETIDTRAILKMLVKRSPEEIRPGLEFDFQDDGVPLFAESAAEEEDGITLSFALTSTKLFPVEPVSIRQAAKLDLKFRNPTTETASVLFQIYNAAEEPIYGKSELLRLCPTDKKLVKGHILCPPEKIDPRVKDASVVTVEFMDVPDDVEILDVGFRSADAGQK